MPQDTLSRSYIISCTPRCGSHLLADGLMSTRVCGRPVERFPRFDQEDVPIKVEQRDALVTEAPPESSYDTARDAQYVREILQRGTTPNGVFGINIHWFQMNDAVRRIGSYLNTKKLPPHEALSAAFPNLSYVWLRRRDKVAQAVSWYKAIQTGHYIKLRDSEDKSSQLEKVEFSYGKIREYWSALRSFDNGWDYFFKTNEIKPHIIYYEDICTDYTLSVLSVLDHLKLARSGVVVQLSKYEKAANQQSNEWIQKFKEIHSSIGRSAGRP